MKVTAEQFEQLALDQLDTLYRVATRLTRDRERAGDLVQETYLRAFGAREGYDLQEPGIRPWLIRIMRNLHLSRAGRENRQPAAVDEQALETARRPYGGGSAIPLGLNRDDLDERLSRALDELQEEYQTVLLLWAVEGFSYKEIAAALEVPMGTVMSRLYRARHKLSEQLRDYAVQEGVVRE